MLTGHTGGRIRPRGETGRLIKASRLLKVTLTGLAGVLALVATGCVFATEPEQDVVFINIPTPTATATRLPRAIPEGRAAPLLEIPQAVTVEASTQESSSTPTVSATEVTGVSLVPATAIPTNTAVPSPTPTAVLSQPQSQPTATATTVVGSASTPTATRTPASPNDPPTIEVLEFDGRSVSSPNDLQRNAKPEEQIDMRVRGKDSDGNLAFIALIGTNGGELDRKWCEENRREQCTVVFSVKAEKRVGETKTFFALAEDLRGKQSNTIQMSILTERAALGSSGGGGGGSSNTPTPTATPVVTTTPILSLESDSGFVNETISLDLTLSEVPDGFSGFHVEITVSEPTIAEITDVLYNPLYSMHTKAPSIFPTASATLFAADLKTMIQGGKRT